MTFRLIFSRLRSLSSLPALTVAMVTYFIAKSFRASILITFLWCYGVEKVLSTKQCSHRQLTNGRIATRFGRCSWHRNAIRSRKQVICSKNWMLYHASFCQSQHKAPSRLIEIFHWWSHESLPCSSTLAADGWSQSFVSVGQQLRLAPWILPIYNSLVYSANAANAGHKCQR